MGWRKFNNRAHREKCNPDYSLIIFIDIVDHVDWQGVYFSYTDFERSVVSNVKFGDFKKLGTNNDNPLPT
jgi:hypothetical protein